MTIETKYNVGDDVWIEVHNEPARGYIKEIVVSQELDKPIKATYRVSYRLSPNEVNKNVESFFENEIFLTVEDYLNDLLTESGSTIKELRKRMGEFL